MQLVRVELYLKVNANTIRAWQAEFNSPYNNDNHYLTMNKKISAKNAVFHLEFIVLFNPKCDFI